ncbi:MAG TPA: peptidylprolyl isomerase [Gemmatimonadales bacterium]|nr:peptidylprolyl isomerase [Gemmatimonadales bacterium]
MRAFALSVLLTLAPLSLSAQIRALTASDSALVGRILLAEDRRDTSDPALAEGRRAGDARIRRLAERAVARITDSAFAKRSSFTPLPPPPVWPEPAWRLRYRALAGQRRDCTALGAALVDSAWPVRLRAADLMDSTCAGNPAIIAVLTKWADEVNQDLSRREPDGVSWQPAAHALLALSRMKPVVAGRRIPAFAGHRNPHLRRYAARAAAAMGDAMTLFELGRDRDPNVREAVIEALSHLTGHADDSLYLAALDADAPQVVRAAALALVGSPDQNVPKRANAVFTRWVKRGNASERDVRVALLQAAGRPASDDQPPAPVSSLPSEAVALALGADVRLRVTMTPASGGGSFVVRLRGDAAPMTAARILELVGERYYDGMAWHRVEPDFVIQGGGPLNNEYSGYKRYFRDELSTVHHVRGTVGMSTRAHDTGDAQWFVNLRDNLRLDQDYTVFGEVVEGMDVVDGMVEGDVIETVRRL